MICFCTELQVLLLLFKLNWFSNNETLTFDLDSLSRDWHTS